MDALEHENKWWLNGVEYLAGVDEAGRGPLAGPVIAAAVIVPRGTDPSMIRDLGVDDSKKLTPKRRSHAAEMIREHFDWSIGQASVDEIDELNILQATFLAARRAIAGLKSIPQMILFDGGREISKLSIKQQAVIDGDAQIFSIAAASIIAKEHRDSIMLEIAREYPGYGFDKHKGYGTKLHISAIVEYGPCPHHRKTFYPISKYYDQPTRRE